MSAKGISKKRLSNIKCLGNNEEKIFSYNETESPLEQVLKSTDKSLYLVAMAGQGKTATLRALWLDFLCGDFEIPCFYIELKFLDKNKQARAIHSYVSNEYKIDLDKIDSSPQVVLLLDGVDELREEFRSKGWFASECVELLKKFRLVISERTYQIGGDRGKEKTSYGLDISQMQLCELCELGDDQISAVGIKVVENTGLHNLLKNNMMLSMYSDLKPYRVDIDQESITAGKLIDLYFNIAFKAKFVKSYLNQLDNEVDLYEEIKKVESLERGDCQGEQRNIFYALQELSEVFEFLKEFSIWMGEEYSENLFVFVMRREDLKEKVKIDLTALDNTSILKLQNDNYYWDNEVYRTYFAACKLRDMLDSLREGKPVLRPSFFQEKKSSYITTIYGSKDGRLKSKGSIFYSFDYLARIFACEMLDLNSKADILNFRNDAKRELSLNKDKAVQSLVIDVDEGLCTYSVIKGWGFPDYATSISPLQFYGCGFIYKIVVPKQITKIGWGAFSGCGNLSEISLSNGLREIEEDVFWGTQITAIDLPESLEKLGDGAFSMTRIKKIKLPSKLKVIGKDTFANCEELKEVILPDGLEEIGVLAFGDIFDGACPSLEQINLPSTLKHIDMMAFCNSGLRRIFLPKSIEEMGVSVFRGCINLTDIYCEHEKQPEGWDRNWLDGCNAKVHWGCKAK